jgi:hypothetical protein
MSMTLTAMATEVAKSIGGHNTSVTTDLATRAIRASLLDWQAAKYWNFLLKDTAAGFTVAGCSCTSGSATVTAPSSGAFDAINIGDTVTVGAGDTVTLAASTTILSYTRSTDGTVATITLSVNFGGTTDTSTSLTFSGDIPLRVGVQEYNFPTDFNSPHSARTLVEKRALGYITYREWNKKVIDHSINGAVEAYTVFNPVSPLTQNFGQTRLRVFRTPATNDTLHVQYFRSFSTTAATVDIPDAYLEMLIDYAIWRFIRLKDTEDTRLPHLYEVALASLNRAMQDDEEQSEDEEQRIISQMEAWNGDRALWSNGNFYPTEW